MLNKYINFEVFFISFCIGLFFAYIITPEPEIIIKYPNPYQEQTFKTQTGTCVKYKAEKTECPADGNYIDPINEEIESSKRKQMSKPWIFRLLGVND